MIFWAIKQTTHLKDLKPYNVCFYNRIKVKRKIDPKKDIWRGGRKSISSGKGELLTNLCSLQNILSNSKLSAQNEIATKLTKWNCTQYFFPAPNLPSIYFYYCFYSADETRKRTIHCWRQIIKMKLPVLLLIHAASYILLLTQIFNYGLY